MRKPIAFALATTFLLPVLAACSTTTSPPTPPTTAVATLTSTPTATPPSPTPISGDQTYAPAAPGDIWDVEDAAADTKFVETLQKVDENFKKIPAADISDMARDFCGQFTTTPTALTMRTFMTVINDEYIITDSTSGFLVGTATGFYCPSLVAQVKLEANKLD